MIYLEKIKVVKWKRPTRYLKDGTLEVNYVYWYEEEEFLKIYLDHNPNIEYNPFSFNKNNYKMRLIVWYKDNNRWKTERDYIDYEWNNIDDEEYF
jgi:hypothetical protein